MGEIARGVQKLYLPAGCARCLGTGYAGRRAFFELLRVGDELRDVIINSPTNTAIQAVLAKQQFQRLVQGGFQLVAEGVAAFSEIERTAGALGK
jgi:type II secretory ATPase GspE/PulE/Tfp pilus assembly ATPase PilB-like protein